MTSDIEMDDIVTGALGPSETPDETAILATKSFEPWHLPRKQHLRIHQWCHYARRLIATLEGELKSRPLRYLSLPGDDLLDIRTLHGVCDMANIYLEYTGFNAFGSPDSPRAIESQLSRNEVDQLPRISKPNSQIINDRIESLGVTESVAATRLRENSFDVVNLDLCTHLTSELLDALTSILNAQRCARARPWLLYLTCRADSSSHAEPVLATLWTRLVNNIDGAVQFSEAISSAFGVSRSDFVSGSPVATTHHARLVALGLSKALVQTLLDAQPQWRTELVELATYRVSGEAPDMISAVFRFEIINTPIQPLAPNRPKNLLNDSPLSEPQLALEALERVRTAYDVDEKMKDARLRDKALRQSRELLKKSRYDTSKYDSWVEQTERSKRLR